MNWSRLRGQPPGLRRLPKEDQPPRPAPLLAQPWAGGMTAWVVIFCTVLAELAGGAVVFLNQSVLYYHVVLSAALARGAGPPGTVAANVARAAPP